MFEFFQEWTVYQISTFILLVITALLTILLGLKKLYDWHKRRQERKECDEIMKDPLEVHFFIPRKGVYEISYEKQDTTVQDKDELEISKDIEEVIFLRIKPRINVKVGDRYFGFKIGERRKKPEISYYNPFVNETSFQRKWYKDWYGHLHMTEERFWYKDEIYVSSFKIKTYDEGDYTFYMTFHLSCNEYKSVKEERHTVATKTLKIRVGQKT